MFKELVILAQLYSSPVQKFDANSLDPIEMIECIYWQRDEIEQLKDGLTQLTVSPEMTRLFRLEEVQYHFEILASSVIPKSQWYKIYTTNWPNGFPQYSLDLTPEQTTERVNRNTRCIRLFQGYEKYLAKSGVIRRHGWSRN